MRLVRTIISKKLDKRTKRTLYFIKMYIFNVEMYLHDLSRCKH